MDTTKFKGLWTALVTPFKKGNGIDNEIDYEALDELLRMQIDGGVTGVLLLGTTGESPTIKEEEKIKIVKFALKKLVGKTKIMVNVGTYSTLKSIENIQKIDKLKGIDAYLVVNPYYNKPTQTGLYRHFTAIAKSTSKEIFLYNIQGRTGVNLETDTLLDIISECPNVIGVKEASGNMLQIKQVMERTGDHFIVLSGDDGLTYELIKHGGDGVISVASNCIPGKMNEFIKACLNNDENAEKLSKEYAILFDKLFIQTNPIPVKTYLAEKGIINEAFRLPICEMDIKEKGEFINFIKENY